VSDIRARFGQRLRELHRTYSSVERGERNVTIETLEKFAAALQLTMASLMPDGNSSPRSRATASKRRP
jgi:transcriptional regulator with XRE-family HTH domain